MWPGWQGLVWSSINHLCLPRGQVTSPPHQAPHKSSLIFFNIWFLHIVQCTAHGRAKLISNTPNENNRPSCTNVGCSLIEQIVYKIYPVLCKPTKNTVACFYWWFVNLIYSIIFEKFNSNRPFCGRESRIRNWGKPLCYFARNIQEKYWSTSTLTDIEQFEYFNNFVSEYDKHKQNTTESNRTCWWQSIVWLHVSPKVIVFSSPPGTSIVLLLVRVLKEMKLRFTNK